MIVHLREFLATVALITIVPGPDTALVIRNAVRDGRSAGLLTAIGCTIGLMVWALAASIGLATILALSASLFGIVRLAGVLYLTALGARFLRSAWRGARHADGLGTDQGLGDPNGDVRVKIGRRARTRRGRAVTEGLLADLLNPKAAAFFTALLPQFVDPGNVPASVVMLGILAAVAALLGFTMYALLAARVSSVLRRRWPAVVLDAVTGLVLLGFGVALLRPGPRAGFVPNCALGR
jgi:threonine/homoserine/homoserine lactone efflux protein